MVSHARDLKSQSSRLTFSIGSVLQVEPFGKKEVAGFVFTPSMPGLFSESLIVENVQDGDNDMVVSVKATVRKTYS